MACGLPKAVSIVRPGSAPHAGALPAGFQPEDPAGERHARRRDLDRLACRTAQWGPPGSSFDTRTRVSADGSATVLADVARVAKRLRDRVRAGHRPSRKTATQYRDCLRRGGVALRRCTARGYSLYCRNSSALSTPALRPWAMTTETASRNSDGIEGASEAREWPMRVIRSRCLEVRDARIDLRL